MTKTTTKTKTQKKCLKHPPYAIFLKSWWLTHSKYDDRYLTMVIVFKPVTLVTLFRSYDQFYRAECITVSGFFELNSWWPITSYNLHTRLSFNLCEEKVSSPIASFSISKGKPEGVAWNIKDQSHCIFWWKARLSCGACKWCCLLFSPSSTTASSWGEVSEWRKKWENNGEGKKT